MVNALVTGGAGSIGSALLRHLRQEGTRVIGIDLRPAEGILRFDIRDRLALRQLFEQTRPEVVFHAAALKHVPELESQPFAAVETNIFGSINVACAAREAGVSKVVLLSTDKAVRPLSVMGKTKHVAEQIFQATQFIIVRLGNVIGSSGSVLPLFEEQISSGGPLTVTHRDMERYFLTSAQAVRALVDSASIGTGGDVLVPRMGVARSILALAEEMIADRAIPVVFSGIRPGEKLSEQLWDPDRERFVRQTDQLSIYRTQAPATNLWDQIEALRRSWAAKDRDRLLTLLSEFTQEKQG